VKKKFTLEFFRRSGSPSGDVAEKRLLSDRRQLLNGKSALFVIFVYAMLLRALHGPTFYDDAYITLRHSRNLCQFGVLSFDVERWVLGASCPLYAAVVGVASLSPDNVETAAYVLGMLGFLVSLALLSAIAYREFGVGHAVAAAALFGCWIPKSLTMACGGMESTLFVSLILSSYMAFDRDRPWACGFLLGLLYLTRPDGLLFGAPLVIETVVRRRDRLVRLLSGQMLILTVWCVFAYLTYGNPVPHSILAKSVIQSGRSFGEIVETWSRAVAGSMAGHPVTDGVSGAVLRGLILVVQVVALVAGIRVFIKNAYGRRLFIASSAYMVSHLILRPITQPWYLTPLFPAIALLLSVGYMRLGKFVVRKTPCNGCGLVWLSAIAAVVFFGLSAVQSGAKIRADRLAFLEREGAYLRLAELLRPMLSPGSLVFAPEIGVVSFATGCRILDPIGLASPEAIEEYKKTDELVAGAGISLDTRDDDLEINWRRLLYTSCRLIERYRPDFIVAHTRFLPYELLDLQGIGAVRYKLVHEMNTPIANRPNLGDRSGKYVIFRRID
jgi:hypothetical protein